METDGDCLYSDHYEPLFRLARNLSGHSTAEAALKSLPGELVSFVETQAAALLTCGCVIEQRRGEPTRGPAWFAVDRDGRELPADFPHACLWGSLCGLASRSSLPLVISSLDEASSDEVFLEQFRRAGSQSLCILRLETPIRQLGLLCIGRAQPDAFPPQVVHFLQLVAQHAALAIDGRLHFANSQRTGAQLKAERTRLQFLLEVNNNVVSILKLRSLLQEISPSIRRVMRLDAVVLILPEPDGKELRVYALDFPGSKGIIREDMRSAMEDSVVGEVFRSGKPWSGAVDDVPGPEINRVMAQREGLKTVCFQPLIRHKTVLGILCLARVREDLFDEEDLELVDQIANQIAVAIDNALAYGQIAELKQKLTHEKLYFEDEIRSEMHFEEIIGASDVLRRLLGQIETVAPTDSTVLISGETGSGKELIARAVHNLSRRRSSAFVKLNCAAIPTGLLESELFGHEKGAFTGAVSRRIGRFELASEGTIFLDEIGEIPLELQPKLLRVLQEREFERLGGSRTQRTNARLIAATNRDLGEMVSAGQFRSDLFYRLNVFPVHVPPLRERAEDIPILVHHFAQQFARAMNKRIEAISAESLRALSSYSWPGNVRELQNVMERAVILSQGPVLKVPVGDLKRTNGLQNGPSSDRNLTLEEAERKHILAVLEQTNWVCAGPNGAAARLGMKRSTLQFRMRKLGINRPQEERAARAANSS
jgi:formate hydrogenlyase transcriptional activator